MRVCIGSARCGAGWSRTWYLFGASSIAMLPCNCSLPGICRTRLPKEFQRELNIPGIARCSTDSPELGRPDRSSGKAEFGMIRQIEKFRPELNLPLFIDRETLED